MNPAPDESTPVETILPELPMAAQLAYAIVRGAIEEELAGLSPNDTLSVCGLVRAHLDNVEELERIAHRAAGGTR